MDILHQLADTQPVAWAVLVLCAVAILGLAIAGIKVRGVGIGIAGVLFAGILVGHMGFGINHDIMDFVREFGLILFVFTIGLQLGPSFFASMRNDVMQRGQALLFDNLCSGSVTHVHATKSAG